MEGFITWLLQNVAWDTIKKALPKAKQKDLALFKKALEQAQHRLDELEQDRMLMEALVDQRDRFHSELLLVKRQLAELQIENAKLQKQLKRAKSTKK